MADTEKGVVEISLDARAMFSELQRLGRSIDGIKGNFESIGSNAVPRATEASGKLGSAINGFAGKFVTFEVAKRMASFADATMRAAKDMPGLTASTKEAAQNYVDIADAVRQTGQGIVLWASQIFASNGPLEYVHNLAVETADAWAYAAGMQTQATRDQIKANDKGLKKADVMAAVENLRTANSELDKAMQLTGPRADDFQEKAMSAMKAAKENFDTALKANNMTQEQGKALLSGGMSYSAVTDSVAMDAFSKRLADGADAAQKHLQDLKDMASQSADELNAYRSMWENTDSYRNMQTPATGNAREYTMTTDKDRARVDAENQRLAEQKKQEEDYQSYRLQLKIDTDAAVKAQDDKLAASISEDRRKSVAEQQAAADAQGEAYSDMVSSVTTMMSTLGQHNRSLAIASMRASEVVAMANAIEGESKAFAQGGPIGFAVGVGVAAKLITEIATIESQMQKLESGGLVRGRNSIIMANENGTEFMANARATRQYLPALTAMNAGASPSQVSSLVGNGQGNSTISLSFAPSVYGDMGPTMREELRRASRDFLRQAKTQMAMPTWSRMQGAM